MLSFIIGLAYSDYYESLMVIFFISHITSTFVIWNYSLGFVFLSSFKSAGVLVIVLVFYRYLKNVAQSQQLKTLPL